MRIAFLCSSYFLFAVSFAFASVEPAVIYDGSQIPTIEIYQMEKLKKDLREQLQFVDFGKVKQRHTKIKFVKFKNNTSHVVTCRGATFTGEGFGYTVENFAVEPGETTAMKVSFYANPASAVGHKTGKLEIRYAHDEPGEEDLFNIQMKAQVYR